MSDVKYMSVKEFREFGYLQELNRQFLHPLGLALEVWVEEDGSERLGGIWDYRDDPEGMNYGSEPDKLEERLAKQDRVATEWIQKTPGREKALGYVIQEFR